MTAAAFKAVALRRMGHNPFSGAVIVCMGPDEHEVTGCLVMSGDNKAKSEELGIDHTRTLIVHIPKLTAAGTASLPRKPGTKDELKYQGRKYSPVSIKGDDDASAVWIVSANAPL